MSFSLVDAKYSLTFVKSVECDSLENWYEKCSAIESDGLERLLEDGITHKLAKLKSDVDVMLAKGNFKEHPSAKMFLIKIQRSAAVAIGDVLIITNGTTVITPDTPTVEENDAHEIDVSDLYRNQRPSMAHKREIAALYGRLGHSMPKGREITEKDIARGILKPRTHDMKRSIPHPKLVQVEECDSKLKTFTFQGRPTQGRAYEYEVIDQNLAHPNTWQFEVFVPKQLHKGGYIVVQPKEIPNRVRLAGLDRRALLFSPATLSPHRGSCYAKLAIADTHGRKTRLVLGRKEPRPSWFKAFHVYRKSAVTTTRGSDAEHPVVLASAKDYKRMIQIYLALKAWVLIYHFDTEAPPQRARSASKRLLGMKICLTGKFDLGTRAEVKRLLKKHGATVTKFPSGATRLLVVGRHVRADDRENIRRAKVHRVYRMSESAFLKRYHLHRR